jgi:hypothetical protein
MSIVCHVRLLLASFFSRNDPVDGVLVWYTAGHAVENLFRTELDSPVVIICQDLS